MCDSVDWSIEVASTSSPTDAEPFRPSTDITRTLSTLKPSFLKSACQAFISVATRATRNGTVSCVSIPTRRII